MPPPGSGSLKKRQDQAYGQSEPEADGIDVAGATFGVAEVLRDLGEPLPRSGHPQAVAALQNQVGRRDDVDVTPAHPADDGVEPLLHSQIVQFPPDEGTVGQRNAAEVDVGTVHPRFLGGRATQLRDESVGDVLAPGDGDQITRGQRLRVVRDDGRPAAGQARYDHLVALGQSMNGQVRVSDEFERPHDER